MGSCFSKKKAPTPTHSRVPALEEEEEETVKEVLSETAKPKKIQQEKEAPPPPIIVDEKAPPIHSCDDTSEISEYCSLSESISTTTITDTTEKKGDEEEVEMRAKVKRSPPKFNRNHDKRERSPARRLDPSPAKRMPVGKATTRYRNPTTTSRRDPGRRWANPKASRNDLSGSSSSKRAAEETKVGGTSCGNESLENPLVSLECFIFL